MKNEERYKSGKERAKAFGEYVNKRHSQLPEGFEVEPLSVALLLEWLEKDAEETDGTVEEALPCPFCGERMEMQLCFEGVWYRCTTHNCYCSPCRETKSEAVHVHNEFAKCANLIKNGTVSNSQPKPQYECSKCKNCGEWHPDYGCMFEGDCKDSRLNG